MVENGRIGFSYYSVGAEPFEGVKYGDQARRIAAFSQGHHAEDRACRGRGSIEIYQLWHKYFRQRGYKLRVQIVDFPGGVPGDVGMTLSWG